MNVHVKSRGNSYYAEAGSWNRDRIEELRSAKISAWRVAAVASAIALFEAAALMFLIPLKTVVPYTLLVDKTTGYVQALKPLEQSAISPDSALTQSFLVQYVLAREGFDIATVAANYRKVALFSTAMARSSYLQTMQASNPESPLQLYPRSTIVDVEVKSVSPIGDHAALVRFDTVRTDPGALPRPAQSWVSVVRYRYSRQPMSLSDRFVNPLGFQVTSYHRDPETVPLPNENPSVISPPATASSSASPLSPGKFQNGISGAD